MPPTRRIFIALFLLTVTISPIQAAEPPAGITAVVSVNSVMEFFDAVDSFAAAALEKTPQSFQPGVLPYMAIAFSPVSLLDVDLDNAAHIIVLGDKGEPVRLAMIATVPDFEAFVASASEGGESEADGDVHRIDTPNDYLIFAVDLGDGMALMAEEREDLDLIRDAMRSWRPEADPGAVLTMTFAGLDGLFFGGDVARYIDRLVADGAALGERTLAQADARGLSEEMIQALVRFGESVGAAAKAEADKIIGGKLALRLDEEIIGVSVVFDAGPDSVLSKAVSASPLPENRIYDSARSVGADAESYTQSPQSIDLLPGSDVFPELSAMLERDLPGGGGKRLAAAYKAWIAAKPEEIVGHTLPDGGNAVSVKAGDPTGAADAVIAFLQALAGIDNDLLRDGSALQPVFVVEENEVAELAYRRLGFSPEAKIRMREFAKKAGIPDIRTLERNFPGANLMLAPIGDRLLLVCDPAAPEDLAKAARALNDPPRDAFVALPQAKRLIDLMEARHFGLGLVKARLIARWTLESLADDPTMPPAGRRLLLDVIPDLIDENGMMGFGHGVRDGKYALEWIATSACVNEMVRNYFLVAEREDALYGTGE